MAQRSTIKKRNSQVTKANILLAAQKLFSEQGYARTGLRDIARQADVSLALPARYFESKAGVFRAALEDALDLDAVFNARKEDFGKNLVQAILDPNMPITAPAMISLAIGDDEAEQIASKFASENIIAPLAKWLGSPHGRARAYVIFMISTGFVIFNRHIIIDSSHASSVKVGAWLAHTTQEIVDGSESSLRAFLRGKSL